MCRRLLLFAASLPIKKSYVSCSFLRRRKRISPFRYSRSPSRFIFVIVFGLLISTTKELTQLYASLEILSNVNKWTRRLTRIPIPLRLIALGRRRHRADACYNRSGEGLLITSHNVAEVLTTHFSATPLFGVARGICRNPPWYVVVLYFVLPTIRA